MTNKPLSFIVSNEIEASIQIFHLDRHSYIEIYHIALISHLNKLASNNWRQVAACPAIRFTEVDSSGNSISDLYKEYVVPMLAGTRPACQIDWILPKVNFSHRKNAPKYVQKIEFCFNRNNKETSGELIQYELFYNTQGNVKTFKYTPQ